MTELLPRIDDLPSREIVSRVVEKHLLFKSAGRAFEKRPPDEDAGAALVESYEAGLAPPWMTAYLLGCLRARCGYHVVRTILISSPGLLAESYAGVAMARISGEEAEKDLLELMEAASSLKAREGAAYGLKWMGKPSFIKPVHDALRRGKIRKDTAAWIIVGLQVEQHELMKWLRTDDPVDRALAVEIAFHLPKGDDAFVAAVRDAMGTVPTSPRRRRRLEEHLA